MDELQKSVDYKNLKFDYVKNTKSIIFYKYMDSKELFDQIRNNKISYDDALKEQKNFLKELNEAKIGGKNEKQKIALANSSCTSKNRQ